MPNRPLPRMYSARFTVAALALVVVGLLSFMALIPLLGSERGTASMAVAALLALIPVIAVGVILLWIDRWEPEPRWLQASAFLWGAGVACLSSLKVSEVFIEQAVDLASSRFQLDIFGAVVVAPLVEETMKAAGVVIIFLLFRAYFHGPVDGIIYGSLIGLGFAFTENILYFTMYWDELRETFFLRAVQAPLLHPMCTAIVGLMLGLSMYMRSRWWALPFAGVGWIVGVLIHAVHNGSAVTGHLTAMTFFFQLPAYAAAGVLALWISYDEQTIIRRHLTDFANHGWLEPFEVDMVSSLPGRRRAMQWARRQGPASVEAMKRFQTEATALALDRERAVPYHMDLSRLFTQEQVRLRVMTRARNVYLNGHHGS